MKSPEILIETITDTVVEFVPDLEIVHVPVVHNCVEPLPANREDIQTASGLVLHLRTEYEFKYRACLDSLN